MAKLTRFLRFRHRDETLLDYAVETLRVLRLVEALLKNIEWQLAEALRKIPHVPSAEAAARGRLNRWATKTPEERRAHAAMMQRAKKERA